MGVIFFAYFEILVRNIYDKKYIYFCGNLVIMN